MLVYLFWWSLECVVAWMIACAVVCVSMVFVCLCGWRLPIACVCVCVVVVVCVFLSLSVCVSVWPIVHLLVRAYVRLFVCVRV